MSSLTFAVLPLLLCCAMGSTNYVINWSISGVEQYKNSPLNVSLGDTVMLQCVNGSFSNIIYQSDSIQFETCDVSASSGINTGIAECDGMGGGGDTLDIRRSSQNLVTSISYEPGESAYFTSYSNGMDINSAISDKMMGGECLAGLKLEIAVFDPDPNIGGVTDDGDGGGGFGIGIIIGIAASGALLLVLLCIGCILVLCAIAVRRKRKSKVSQVTPEPPETKVDKVSKAEQGHSISSIQVQLLGNEEVHDPKEVQKIKALDAKQADKGKANGASSKVEVARYDVPRRPNGSQEGTDRGGRVMKETKAQVPKATAQAEKKKAAASGPGSKSTTSGEAGGVVTIVGGKRSNTVVSYKPESSSSRRSTTASHGQHPRTQGAMLTKKMSVDGSTSSGGTKKGSADLPFKPIAKRTGDSSKPSASISTKPTTGPGARKASGPVGVGGTSNVKAGKPPASSRKPESTRTVTVAQATARSQGREEAGKTQAHKAVKASYSVPPHGTERQGSAPHVSTSTPVAITTTSSSQSLPPLAPTRRAAPLPPVGMKTSINGQQGGVVEIPKHKPSLSGPRRPPPQTPTANGTTTHSK